MTARDAQVAAALRGPPQPSAVPLSPNEEAAAVDAVTAALRARRTLVAPVPKQWPRRLLALAAIGVAVAGGRWLATRSSPPAAVEAAAFATVSRGSTTALLQEGDGVDTGDRVRTAAEGAAQIRFVGGTTIRLGAKTDVSVTEAAATRRFLLNEGVLTASVVKLQAGQRFIIETTVAEVEVRGTEFTVEANPASDGCSSGTTVVLVREGLVSVGSEGVQQLVHPGERLALGCQPPDPSAQPSIDTEPVEPPKATAPTSSLARMNAVYARAMALKRQGQATEAVRELQRLRRAFPSGPLDEAAAVEELRLLEQFDTSRARAAARRYLGDYPNGYGRDIAERLATP